MTPTIPNPLKYARGLGRKRTDENLMKSPTLVSYISIRLLPNPESSTSLRHISQCNIPFIRARDCPARLTENDY